MFNDKNRNDINIDTSIRELYFDDQCLDEIISGKVTIGPSSTEINLKSKKIMGNIRNAFNDKNIQELLIHITDLIKCEDFHQIENKLNSASEEFVYGIPDEMYSEIVQYFKVFIPTYPNPILTYNTKKFGAVFSDMWQNILSRNETFLREQFGSILYRWYEHYKYYNEAREVLNLLINIAKYNNDKIGEAIYINNFAYEYLLEKKWDKAKPLFEKAAKLFWESKNNVFEYYNSRVNYLRCIVELSGKDSLNSIEKELFEISIKLNNKNDYKSHKPLYLLSKIEEKRGNIDKAIYYIEQAISISAGSKTKYPDEDREYLEILKRKISADQKKDS